MKLPLTPAKPAFPAGEKLVLFKQSGTSPLRTIEVEKFITQPTP